MVKSKKCVLCEEKYEGHGNNAQPLSDGFCCDVCNRDVIMARLKGLKGGVAVIAIGIRSRDKRYKEAQAEATKLAREVNGRRKAGIWVCHRIDLGPDSNFPNNKRGRCEHCGEPICYDDALKKHMLKNAKKICRVCIINVDEYSKNIDPKQIKYLKEAYGN